jgi:hypothetical protein
MYILFLLWVILVSFTIFLQIRNKWLLKKKREWNDKVYVVMINWVETSDVRHEYMSYDELYGCIYSFDKMMVRFWVFDLRKMCSDTDIFDLVEEEYRKVKAIPS